MNRKLPVVVLALVLCGATIAFSAGNPNRTIDVATFDKDGKLIYPADTDQWVFLGSSLGMGYSQRNFDSDSPGMFQIVRMEPTAYKEFVKTGQFPDGTMIALHFYEARNNISINRAGFVMRDLLSSEIHFKDSRRFPDGFNFYNFDNGQVAADAVTLPNQCVECHSRDAAYDAVFVQFYPGIHKYLPKDVQAELAQADADAQH